MKRYRIDIELKHHWPYRDKPVVAPDEDEDGEWVKWKDVEKALLEVVDKAEVADTHFQLEEAFGVEISLCENTVTMKEDRA